MYTESLSSIISNSSISLCVSVCVVSVVVVPRTVPLLLCVLTLTTARKRKLAHRVLECFQLCCVSNWGLVHGSFVERYSTSSSSGRLVIQQVILQRVVNLQPFTGSQLAWLFCSSVSLVNSKSCTRSGGMIRENVAEKARAK